MFNFFSTFEKFTVQLQELVNKLMLFSSKFTVFSDRVEDILNRLLDRVNTDIDTVKVKSIIFTDGTKYVDVEFYKEDDVVYVMQKGIIVAMSTCNFTCEF